MGGALLGRSVSLGFKFVFAMDDGREKADGGGV